MNCQSTSTVLVLALAIGTTVSAQQVTQPDVREYIRGQALHGDSYEELSTMYDSTAVPALIEALNSDAEEENWARAAYLLGVVGDERTAEPLIDFIEKGDSPSVSRDHNRARKAAMQSLGYLINRTRSERALDYLVEGLTPSIWRDRNVMGVVPYADSYAEYDLLLSKYALFGLALSGHPQAGEALRSVLRSPTPEQLQFRDSEESTLTQWLEVHSLVAERGVTGMDEYYESKHRLELERQLEEVQRLREAQRTRP